MQKQDTGVAASQGLVVPQWFYYWAQAERKYPSFTALEKRMLILFFYWAVSRTRLNVTSPQRRPSGTSSRVLECPAAVKAYDRLQRVNIPQQTAGTRLHGG